MKEVERHVSYLKISIKRKLAIIHIFLGNFHENFLLNYHLMSLSFHAWKIIIGNYADYQWFSWYLKEKVTHIFLFDCLHFIEFFHLSEAQISTCGSASVHIFLPNTPFRCQTFISLKNLLFVNAKKVIMEF